MFKPVNNHVQVSQLNHVQAGQLNHVQASQLNHVQACQQAKTSCTFLSCVSVDMEQKLLKKHAIHYM